MFVSRIMQIAVQVLQYAEFIIITTNTGGEKKNTLNSNSIRRHYNIVSDAEKENEINAQMHVSCAAVEILRANPTTTANHLGVEFPKF